MRLSDKMIEAGGYDNSGVIVRHHEQINGVLFALDLTVDVVFKAVELNCDTIITHHPAIYTPIKNLNCDGDTEALLKAVSAGLNVISMHLNLDIAKGGIDDCLCEGLGGKNPRVIKVIDGECGYGKEAETKGVKIQDFVNKIKAEFNSDKIIYYGEKEVKKFASFCGGGASEALEVVKKGLTDADTIVTSDMPHHILLSLVTGGKQVIILPHFVSEEYGFKKFYGNLSKKLKDELPTYYFTDKRFL